MNGGVETAPAIGRAANYVYGAAKAGFAAFLSGLCGRLVAAGVRVVAIEPGFVRTHMTAGMDLPPLPAAEPDEAAGQVRPGALAAARIVR